MSSALVSSACEDTLINSHGPSNFASEARGPDEMSMPLSGRRRVSHDSSDLMRPASKRRAFEDPTASRMTKVVRFLDYTSTALRPSGRTTDLVAIGSQFSLSPRTYPSTIDVENCDVEDGLEDVDWFSITDDKTPTISKRTLQNADTGAETTLVAQSNISPESHTLVDSDSSDHSMLPDILVEHEPNAPIRLLHSEKRSAHVDWELYGRHEAGPLSSSFRHSFPSKSG
ncbi:hypothetical protein MBLNU459_g0343t1 [Dothideomycetes sp. NU459]